MLAACVSAPRQLSEQEQFLNAGRNGEVGQLRELLPFVNINEDLGSASALQLAAFNAHYDAVVFLVERGADVYQRDPANGWTALDFALTGQSALAREDHPRVIEYLESQQ